MTYTKNRKIVPKYSPCLDHNHSTGAVRGVLCRQCNSAEGKILSIMNRYHHAKTEEERANFYHGLSHYMAKHQTNQTGLLHPDHKTEEEKRLLRNAKARKRYRNAAAT